MFRATMRDLQVMENGSSTQYEYEEEGRPSDWHRLYRVAGIGALTVLALIPIQALVYIVWPPPTTTLDNFDVFQRNALLGFLDLDMLLVVDQLLIIVVLLGLYVVLRHVDASLMLVGATAGLLGATFMLVSREATFSMFSLSQQYAAAQSDAERAALAAAGQALLTMYNGTSFSLGYFLTGLAMLLMSIVMLRSPRFSRLTGLTGLAAGVTGLVPASMGTVGFVLSFVSLVPLMVWLFLVGRRFLQFSGIRRRNRRDGVDPPRTTAHDQQESPRSELAFQRSVTVRWTPNDTIARMWMVGGVALTIAGVALFASFQAAAHGGDSSFTLRVSDLPLAGTSLVVLVALVFALHELVHGVVLLCYGVRPRFGVQLTAHVLPALYTTAPGEQFTRLGFLTIALAPLAVLSFIGALFIILMPFGGWLVLPLGAHLGGCTGDLWLSALVLRQPRGTRVEDQRDGLIFLRRTATRQAAAVAGA